MVYSLFVRMVKANDAQYIYNFLGYEINLKPSTPTRPLKKQNKNGNYIFKYGSSFRDFERYV